MDNALHSHLIGAVEVILAIIFYHRALPAMIGISADAAAMQSGVSERLDAIAASPTGWSATLRALAAELTTILTARIMMLKMWALATALGMFGVGRLFPPYYYGADAWLFNIGHWCLITYCTLRLIQISRASQSKWWRQL